MTHGQMQYHSLVDTHNRLFIADSFFLPLFFFFFSPDSLSLTVNPSAEGGSHPDPRDTVGGWVKLINSEEIVKKNK